MRNKQHRSRPYLSPKRNFHRREYYSGYSAPTISDTIQSNLNLIKVILQCMSSKGSNIAPIKDAITKLLQNSDVTQIGTLISHMNDVEVMFQCIFDIIPTNSQAMDL